MEKTSLGLLDKTREEKQSQLFKDCLLFWAFSDQQFLENKTKLEPGEKYVHIGHGGYLPKGKVDQFLDGMEAINKWYKSEIKSNGLRTKKIAYELSNHEAYYTGDIEDTLAALGPDYTAEEVTAVFEANKEFEDSRFAKGGAALKTDSPLTFSKSEDQIDIFGAAQKKTAGKKTAKDDKIQVEVPGLETKLLTHQSLKAEIADLEALFNSVTDEIKTISKEKFLELYKLSRHNPKTFLIKDGDGCIMVLPNDKYITITEERAAQLIAEYGDAVVTVDTKFYFTPAVLERNMLAIQKLIMDATNITVADKQNLLTKETKYSISKGSIDRLFDYGKNLDSILADIQPIFALKNCGGGDDKKASGGMITGRPAITGYSLCHYSPVLDGSHTCSSCHKECVVMSEEELMNQIAEDSNEGDVKEWFPEGSNEIENMHEARHYAAGGSASRGKEYEISLPTGVYWGNYHWDGNELMMDTCLTNNDDEKEVEVEDNDIRLKVYDKLEKEKADEKMEQAEYEEELRYAIAEEHAGFATGGAVNYTANPEYIELNNDYQETLAEMKALPKTERMKIQMLATRLEIIQQKKKRIALGESYNPNPVQQISAKRFAKGGSAGEIKVGGKVGFLNPKNGRYRYSEVTAIQGDKVELIERHPTNSQWDNRFAETLERLYMFSKEDSPDWKDGRKLVRIMEDGGIMANGGPLTYSQAVSEIGPRGTSIEKVAAFIRKNYSRLGGKGNVLSGNTDIVADLIGYYLLDWSDLKKELKSAKFAEGGLMNKKEQFEYWNEEARKHLLGKTVKAASFMRPDEAEAMGWDGGEHSCLVIEFTDGSLIYASQDDEGNGPGFLNMLSIIKGSDYEFLKRAIVGATVIAVEYMQPGKPINFEVSGRKVLGVDIAKYGFYSAPVAITLRKGIHAGMDVILFPQSDPEGNDAGALFGQTGNEQWTLPVISINQD